MTRSQAIRIYLNAFIHSDTLIRRIMQWNLRLSIRDNATKQKVYYDVMRLMARRFKLKYKKVGKGNNYGGLKNA